MLRHEGIKVPKGMGEIATCEKLIRHAMQDISPGHLDELLALRGRVSFEEPKPVSEEVLGSDVTKTNRRISRRPC